MNIGRIFVATMVGTVLSACLFLLIYTLQYRALTDTFLRSGTAMASLLFWALPDAFVYWLVPEGGGPAAVLIIAFSVWLQCMLFFSALAYVFLRRRSGPTSKWDALRHTP
jgi:hypothetical protein